MSNSFEYESKIQSFREALASSKSIIVLAGAGLSAASGLPTYRAAGGWWVSHNEVPLSTPQAFKDILVPKGYPNAAHYALASLGDPSILSRIAPSLGESATPPLLITQHIDSLSLRALDALPAEAKVAAEKRLLEMHGSIFVTRCTSCQHTLRSHDTPLASALIDPERHDIPVAELRRCGGEKWSGSNRYGKCGGLLRPSVTWFGEVPEHMGEIARQLNWCDMLLVVGTSFTVQPASRFASTVKSQGGKVAIFNLEPTKGDQEADFIFLGPCAETLPHALGV